MKFTKMHGCGNDYVYVNLFEEKLDDPCLREESSEQTKQAAESNFQMQKNLENRE